MSTGAPTRSTAASSPPAVARGASVRVTTGAGPAGVAPPVMAMMRRTAAPHRSHTASRTVPPRAWRTTIQERNDSGPVAHNSQVSTRAETGAIERLTGSVNMRFLAVGWRRGVCKSRAWQFLAALHHTLALYVVLMWRHGQVHLGSGWRRAGAGGGRTRHRGHLAG